MEERAQRTEWQAEELYRHLDAGDAMFILDVRNEDEYETWKIEGRDEVPTINVPYYEMLEVDEHDDVVDSFKEYLTRTVADRLPKEAPVLAVCAKGDTSEYVAEALRRLGFNAFNLAGGTAAWGDFYRFAPVVAEGSTKIWQASRSARGCLSYVLVDGGRAVVIDPLRHVDRYLHLAEREGFTISLVLDTHGHADHISGGARLAEATGAPYHLHPYDGIHPLDVLPARLDYDYLKEGQTFEVGSVTIRSLHVPGHTLGQVVFLANDRWLFAGDSIFLESIARPDLGGRGETWAPLHHASLGRLLALPDDTLVLPGHFSHLDEAGEGGLFAAPLGRLRRENEGLVMAAKQEDEFVRYILESLPRFPEEYVEIKRVNAGLVVPSESKASELEIGKNVCALSDVHEE